MAIVSLLISKSETGFNVSFDDWEVNPDKGAHQTSTKML